MPLEGFKPTIPVFKRAKTVQALDRAAPVTGQYISFIPVFCTNEYQTSEGFKITKNTFGYYYYLLMFEGMFAKYNTQPFHIII
jgi:hypothetical protein